MAVLLSVVVLSLISYSQSQGKVAIKVCYIAGRFKVIYYCLSTVASQDQADTQGELFLSLLVYGNWEWSS